MAVELSDGLWGGIIGHADVLDLLRAEASSPAQAYLFVGPQGVGKALVARRFAAALLCDDPGCVRRVLEGIHPDLMLVDPEGTTAITVDQARSTVSQASLAPLEGARKAFVFEDGGLMNDEAANALLKTLEEPTPSSVFIIVAESEDDLPATVASRCRTVVFGRVSEETVAEALAEQGIDPDDADQVARISGGRPGLALGLATRPEVADFRRAWLEIPLHAPDHPGGAFLLADRVVAATEPLLAALKERQDEVLAAAEEDGAPVKLLKARHERESKRAAHALYLAGLEILASFYRDAAATQFGAPARNPDIPPHDLTQLVPADALANAERVFQAIELLEANQRPRLALANLFADLGANVV